MQDRRRWQIIFLLFLALAACAHSLHHQAKSGVAPGIYHQVKPGETLYGIGRRYGISHQELARLNHISNPDRIWVGQKIFIPQASRPAHSSDLFPPSASHWSLVKIPVKLLALPLRLFSSAKEAPPEPRWDGKAPFAWPLKGVVTSRFGSRNGSFHDGIDIGAPKGTPVRAAADGRVIYSDVLRGYGNVIIVRHGRGYVTVYAHNRVNYVKEGEEVQRGQRIAEVGTSGRSTGPSLHFEVRKDNLARDPLHYLPRDGRLVQSRTP